MQGTLPTFVINKVATDNPMSVVHLIKMTKDIKDVSKYKYAPPSSFMS